MNSVMVRLRSSASAILVMTVSLAVAQGSRDRYTKYEYMIPMRDGVKLYTAVYVPKEVKGKHPILMERTPYSAGPYGPDRYGFVGGEKAYRDAGYIFAFQDVRGQYMSEGAFANVRPMLKAGEKGIDESTDTWDTVDYLVKNVPENNGAVGLRGVSYPGFYAGAGAVNTHPALKAVSPQAPVSDWFLGDDVHHNGAFFLQDNLDFSAWFDAPRTGPEKSHSGVTVEREGKAAYDFFLSAGSVKGMDDLYLKGRIPYWNELIEHPNYDQYWKDRALPTHMKGVKCAVLTVGGWFDAEDMWGALNLYKQSEKQNPGTPNYLVMGPWYHGMWAGGTGRKFGDLDFGSSTSFYYRNNIEFPFFEKYLRGQTVPAPAEATVFETGTNEWKTFAEWPPKGLAPVSLYLGEKQSLGLVGPGSEAPDSYTNDPAEPTPYVADYKTSRRRPREYMIADQRFASSRSDVLSYTGQALASDLTVAGPVSVDFWMATTGSDADLIVKVIDVWPGDATEKTSADESMADYQQLLRGDVFRCRFRDSFEKPKALVPGKPTRIKFTMNDVLHTFKKGHKIMIQVQSSWFPLVDRNPNTFVDVYTAKPEDYKKATITIFHDKKRPSLVRFGALAGAPAGVGG